MTGGASERSGGARHLYVHLPFCAHRCGYCDFVTAVGRGGLHAPYVTALLAELELERSSLAAAVETVYVGGGTPTYTEPDALRRLLEGLPRAPELTVEANPETVTPQLARLLASAGVNRVSLGVQTFVPRLLAVLERRAGPDAVRAAVSHLRAAGIDNISLDLLYGIPGQEPSDLEADLERALALSPDHLSCYELEAKPGTRFTHAWGEALARQADAMERYLELVVERLVGAGYRWYETSSFCLPGRESRHNLAYWRGRDYLGVGVGAVSTLGSWRRTNRPSVRAYIRALEAGSPPARTLEPLDDDVRTRERLILGLRLDEPLSLDDVGPALDRTAVGRLERLGLVEQQPGGLVLTPAGRRLGNAATVELLAESPAN